jgi:DNA-binding NtrC family response regulator
MDNGKKYILVVDNEPAILWAFRRLLTTPEIQVDGAKTFEEAMAMIQNNQYQAIVADLRLSGVLGEEGLAILRYIRRERPQVNFILITGYGTPEIQKMTLDEGADFYLEKPVSIYTLQEKLSQLGFTYKVPLAAEDR